MTNPEAHSCVYCSDRSGPCTCIVWCGHPDCGREPEPPDDAAETRALADAYRQGRLDATLDAATGETPGREPTPPGDERPAEIWIDRRRHSGDPCIHGTRLPVETLARYAADCGDDAALAAYPSATVDDLDAARWFLTRWQPIVRVELPEPGDPPPCIVPMTRATQAVERAADALFHAMTEGDLRLTCGALTTIRDIALVAVEAAAPYLRPEEDPDDLPGLDYQQGVRDGLRQAAEYDGATVEQLSVLDDVRRRDDLPAQWQAASRVIDGWLHADHGVTASRNGLGGLLAGLVDAGYRIVPPEAS